MVKWSMWRAALPPHEPGAINERIKPGAVIAFDELVEFGEGGYSNWRDGEWKALVEWMGLYDREVKPICRAHCQRAVLIVTK